MKKYNQFAASREVSAKCGRRSVRFLVTAGWLAAIFYNIESPSKAEDLTQALQAAYQRSEVIANAVAEYEADLERVTISRQSATSSWKTCTLNFSEYAMIHWYLCTLLQFYNAR